MKNISIHQNLIFSELSFVILNSLYLKQITSYFDDLINSFSDTYLMKKLIINDCFPTVFIQFNTTSLLMTSSISLSKIMFDNFRILSFCLASSTPKIFKVINSTFFSLISQQNGGVI